MLSPASAASAKSCVSRLAHGASVAARVTAQDMSMGHRCRDRRRRSRGLARGRHARPRRHRRRAGRSASGLSAGFPLREARRHADCRRCGRPGSPTRCCAPRRLTGECWVARFGRLVEKRPGDQHGILYDTLVNTVRAQIPTPHRIHPRQGHRHRDQPRAADRQALERRGDLRAARRSGDRAQHRPAPQARHRARDHQPRSFDLDRLRRRAGRAARVPVLRR